VWCLAFLAATGSIFNVFVTPRSTLKSVVDMPNQRASSLVRLVLQNHGRLSNKKRRQFPELRDDEWLRMEAGIRAASGVGEAGENPFHS
jgi:hypothetical protein